MCGRMKIRIDPLDRLFSEYIRKRSAGGCCERCGKFYGWEKLQCAHFHGRRKKSVRWDEDNACALCFGCHSYLDSQPMEKVEFFKERLGKEKFQHLNIRAGMIQKPDKVAIEIYLRTKIKEQGG